MILCVRGIPHWTLTFGLLFLFSVELYHPCKDGWKIPNRFSMLYLLLAAFAVLSAACWFFLLSLSRYRMPFGWYTKSGSFGLCSDTFQELTSSSSGHPCLPDIIWSPIISWTILLYRDCFAWVLLPGEGGFPLRKIDKTSEGGLNDFSKDFTMDTFWKAGKSFFKVPSCSYQRQ